MRNNFLSHLFICPFRSFTLLRWYCLSLYLSIFRLKLKTSAFPVERIHCFDTTSDMNISVLYICNHRLDITVKQTRTKLRARQIYLRLSLSLSTAMVSLTSFFILLFFSTQFLSNTLHLPRLSFSTSDRLPFFFSTCNPISGRCEWYGHELNSFNAIDLQNNFERKFSVCYAYLIVYRLFHVWLDVLWSSPDACTPRTHRISQKVLIHSDVCLLIFRHLHFAPIYGHR